jgi:hypothetical protein
MATAVGRGWVSGPGGIPILMTRLDFAGGLFPLLYSGRYEEFLGTEGDPELTESFRGSRGSSNPDNASSLSDMEDEGVMSAGPRGKGLGLRAETVNV